MTGIFYCWDLPKLQGDYEKLYIQCTAEHGRGSLYSVFKSSKYMHECTVHVSKNCKTISELKSATSERIF